jgi:hypothetical protein
LQHANRGSAFELAISAPQLFNILQRLGGVSLSNPTSMMNLFKGDDGTLKFGPGLELRFPLAIGYAANGLGFGFWDQIAVDTRIHGEFIELGVRADLVTSVGIATTVIDLLGHSVDAGIAIKPFVRVMTDGIKRQKATDFLSKLDNMDTLLEEVLAGAGLPLIGGLGVDAGLMYRYRQFASFGISFNDIVTRGAKFADLSSVLPVNGLTGTTTTAYYVPFTLNIGAAGTVALKDFFPDMAPVWGSTSLAVMADWHDMLNQHWGSKITDLEDKDGNAIRNPILNLSFGLELGLFDIIKIQGGINEMLPSFGLGFNFGAFQISTAVYGQELGNEPGQFSTYAVDLSISVRPESKEKVWPWRGPLANKLLVPSLK